MKKISRALLLVFPFAALFIFFLWDHALVRKAFILNDYLVQHWPWAIYTAISARFDTFPWWTSGMACGFPLFAEGQSASLYFWHYLGYRWLPFMTAYSWSVPVHMALAGLGMFMYARRTALSKEGALLAAVIFCFSSAYAGCFYNTGSMKTLVWLPWVVYLLELLRARGAKVAGFVLAGISLLVFQQWCAGFPQMALYAFAFYVLYELIRLRESRLGFGVLLLSLTLGTAMAWPQLSATIELIGQSVRQKESVAFALWGSVPPVAPLTLFYPEWGVSLRYSFYLGILPVFLVILSWVYRTKGWGKHAFLAVVFFLLALGKYNPVYVWLVEASGLTSMRNPSKFLFFVSFSMAMLAGFGLDGLERAIKQGALLKKGSRSLLTLAAIVALLPLLGRLAILAFHRFYAAFSERYVAQILSDKGALAKDREHYQAILDRFFESLPNLFSYANPQNLRTLALIAVSCGFLCFLAQRLRRSSWRWAVICLILVWDLGVYGFFMGTGFAGNSGEWKATTLSREQIILKQGTLSSPGYTFAELNANAPKELFYPNANMAYGLDHAGGYSPLLLKRYDDLAHDLGLSDTSLGRKAVSPSAWRNMRGLIDLMGIRWVHADQPLDLRGLVLTESGQDFFIYENTSALPEFVAYERYRYLPDTPERLSHMRASAFEPTKEIVIEDERILQGLTLQGEPVTMEILAHQRAMQGASLIRVRASADALVLFRQSFYPGWRLTVDGKERPIFRAHHLFCGFGLPRGEHELELRFEPTQWKRSWLVFGISLGILVLAICAQIIYNKARKR